MGVIKYLITYPYAAVVHQSLQKERKDAIQYLTFTLTVKQLLDEAMSNIKIYSVETRNIRRGR